MARPPCCPRRSTSSCMKARADWGAVSRPSSQAWIATGSSCRCPSITAATRWWSSACTPPLPIRPSRCRVRPVRGPCLFAILEGMQFSHALRALPVVCSLAPALPAPSPDTTGQAAARYRVATDGEWFYQEVTGKRLARLARGAVVTGGDTKGEWIGVTLDGWIFGTSVGVTPRAGFDLAVTRAPEENLRAAPGGTIVAKLAEGFLLTKLGA